MTPEKSIGRLPAMARTAKERYRMESGESCTICGERVFPPRADSTHPTCSDMDEPEGKKRQLLGLAKIAWQYPGLAPTMVALVKALVEFEEVSSRGKLPT